MTGTIDIEENTAAQTDVLSEHKSWNKERITIRLDRDVLNWFREQSPNQRGYQSRINQALRQYMNDGAKSTEETIRNVIQDELQKIKATEEA